MKKIDILFKVILLVMFWSVGSQSWAACRFVGYDDGKYAGVSLSGSTLTEGSVTSGSWGRGYNVTDVYDNSAAKIRVGNIHLMDIDVQPAGTILANTSVPPTEYKVRNANPERLIWACSPSTNMNNVVFLTSVNGDDRVGGYYEVNEFGGNAGGIDNVYYTWFKGVGIRQIMNGTVLTPKWTAIPLTEYETGDTGKPVSWARDKCQPGWKCIRLKHLPTLEFQLVRVTGQPPYTTSASTYCNTISRPTNPGATGDDRGMGRSGNYDCNQPSSYMTLGSTNTVGAGSTGNTDVAFRHDGIGVRHNTSASTWMFWDSSNGFGYTLYNAVHLYSTIGACKVSYNTPSVNFGNVTSDYLNSNIARQSFYVDVDCQTGVNSGLNTGQVAIGIQPSQGAYDAANALGLVNGSFGVEALLDNNYGDMGVAGNVGIYIKPQSTGNYITLLGQPGATGTLPVTTGDYSVTCGGTGVYNSACYPAVAYPKGNVAGWYPVLQHATAIGTNMPKTGFTRYRINYDADLKKINPAQSVTAGSINSTAYVVVKIQ